MAGESYLAAFIHSPGGPSNTAYKYKRNRLRRLHSQFIGTIPSHQLKHDITLSNFSQSSTISSSIVTLERPTLLGNDSIRTMMIFDCGLLMNCAERSL